ncbi:MAG: alpha/beta hydrolase family protein [Promethearchaeota archaeon]
MYANLYYPSKHVTFQKKSPLIIYLHGIGGQRDLDLRAPLEFTKRGFYVVTLDYQGHGESQGSLLDIDKESNIPVIAEDCSKLLDILEEMKFYKNDVNISQIGLFGHSMGGMIALISNALDSRFSATVTWAAPVKMDIEKLDVKQKDTLKNYMPINLLNENNSKNLLIIHHIDDEVVPYKENALVIKDLTNCKLISIKKPLIGGGHTLFSDYVLEKTINWFEKKFFGSETINGKISFSYIFSYILLFISLIALFLTVLSIIAFSSKYFLIYKDNTSEYFPKNSEQKKIIKISKRIKYIQYLKIICYSAIFLSIWIIFRLIFGLIGLIIAPIVMILFYAFMKIKDIINWIKKEEKIYKAKHHLISQFEKYVLAFSFFSTGIFLLAYGLFSLSYPFAFFFPSDLLTYFMAASIYPFYIAIELFYRKIIYPKFYFIESIEKKTIIIILLIIINQMILMLFTIPFLMMNAILATYLISLIVAVLNSLIYEKTGKISSVLISSFIIIQIFFGSAINQVLGGVDTIITLFV